MKRILVAVCLVVLLAGSAAVAQTDDRVWSDWSETSTAVTPSEPEPDPSLAAPRNVQADPVDHETVTVGWDAVEGADGYEVACDEHTVETVDTSYTFDGLTAETSYDCRVRAYAETVSEPVSGDRGPAGRWPDGCPAYDSSADVVLASMDGLASAVASASAGDVIEVPAGEHELDVELSGGPSGGKVLVRPPLGQRGQFVLAGGRLRMLDLHDVCLAGWTVRDIEVRADDGSAGLALAWWEWEGNARSVFRGVVGLDLYEHVRAEMSTYQGSALHLIRNSGELGSSDVHIVGWWHAGMWREEGASNQAKDTIQTFHLDGGTINDVTIEDSVLFASSDKVMQNHHSESRRLTFRNVWMNRPEDPFWTPPDGYTTHGSHGGVSVQEPGTDVTLEGSTIMGSFSGSSSTGVKRDNLAVGGSAWDALTDDGGNVEDSGLSVASNPPPALPDLDDVWHP